MVNRIVITNLLPCGKPNNAPVDRAGLRFYEPEFVQAFLGAMEGD